jgi:hypothetical protein
LTGLGKIGRIVERLRQREAAHWLFVGGLTFLLLAIAALYPGSELHRRNMIGQLASGFFNTLHSQTLKG